jgi:uracil DNA glycosylase
MLLCVCFLQGFLGCRHFSATNKLLVQSGQPPVDWQIVEL